LYTHPKPPSPRYELGPKFLVAARRSLMLKDLRSLVVAVAAELLDDDDVQLLLVTSERIVHPDGGIRSYIIEIKQR